MLSRNFFRISCHLCRREHSNTARNQSTLASPVWTNTKIGEVEIQLSHGKIMRISTGKLARFADGSAVIHLGDTSVMVTAVGRTLTNLNASFVPLVVDYRQKAAAAGRIPTNFLRRELGPTEREILTGRMIDRSLRPLFRNAPYCDIQIVCNLLAVDGIHDPDILAINGASAALTLSDIPWEGPIGAVRVGLINSDLVINPTRKEQQSSKLNLVIAAADHNRVVMIDSSADNVLQQDFMKAVKFGVKEAQKIIGEMRKMQKICGKPKRTNVSTNLAAKDLELVPKDVETPLAETGALIPVTEEQVTSRCSELATEKLRIIFTDPAHNKISRDVAVGEVRTIVLEALRKEFPTFENGKLADIFNNLSKELFRNLIFERNQRCDGRGLDDLRFIRCQVGIYDPLHGSALFERGQTQVLCTVTFDSLDSAWKADPVTVLISGLKEKNFMLHYEFPPYATNETGRITAGRRELGHGALAEKALRAIIPENFPFTIRLTSEVLESNGSSSMATICGGSLALMDAGVPVSGHAAGVAIGLVTKYDERNEEIVDYRILTDILGIEDYLGDMDFKMAGTRNGITALQADVKVPGLPLKIVMEAIQKATDGRIKILDIMNESINEPRKERKENAPVTEKLDIPPQKRAKFIGFGGYNLRKITTETGVQITQVDDLTYNLFAPNQTAMDEAKQMIKETLEEEQEPDLQFGAVYAAKIVEIKDTGVMITLYPGQAPFLLPNSQLDMRKISHPSVLNLEVGQEISVKYFGRDPATGRHRASRKVLMSVPSSATKSFHD